MNFAQTEEILFLLIESSDKVIRKIRCFNAIGNMNDARIKGMY